MLNPKWNLMLQWENQRLQRRNNLMQRLAILHVSELIVRKGSGTRLRHGIQKELRVLSIPPTLWNLVYACLPLFLFWWRVHDPKCWLFNSPLILQRIGFSVFVLIHHFTVLNALFWCSHMLHRTTDLRWDYNANSLLVFLSRCDKLPPTYFNVAFLMDAKIRKSIL